MMSPPVLQSSKIYHTLDFACMVASLDNGTASQVHVYPLGS